MKPIITCKRVWNLIAQSITSDHQCEQIPAPVYRGLFHTTKEDMEDTILDLIEDITNEPLKRRQ
jgi:hypothetical protein